MPVLERVMAYVRPWSKDYYRFFIPQAFPNARPIVVSDWKGLGDFDLSGAFYRYMGQRGEDVLVPVWLDHWIEHEIILRNFMLRSLPLERASRMLRAMSRAIEDALEAFEPTAMLSPAVDSYVMDLFHRHCVMRGIPFCGMLPCPFPNFTRATAVGEHLNFRDPSAAEVDAAISAVADPDFKPVDLTEWLKMYGSSRVHLKRGLRELPKRYVFPMVGHLRGDSLNYHYLASALSSVSFFSQALLVHKQFDSDWLTRMRAWKGTKVYIPLQAYPECTTDYHVSDLDLIDFPRVLPRLVDQLAKDPDILICIKEHPGMMGVRPPGFYESLRRRKNVLLLSGDIPASSLIAETDVLVTWTGTGGLESLLRGKRVVTLGRPYYAAGDAVIAVSELKELEDVADMVKVARSSSVDATAKRAIARHVLAGTLPGEYKFIRFDNEDHSLRSDAMNLAMGTAAHWDSWADAFDAHHAPARARRHAGSTSGASAAPC